MSQHNEWDQYPVDLRNTDVADRAQRIRRFNEARKVEEVRMRKLQESPELVEAVRHRTKKSLGRTASIPIRYGEEDTGEALAFTLRANIVHLVFIETPTLYVKGGGNHPSMNERVLTEEGDAMPLDFHCGEMGGLLITRSRVWLFEKAVRALLGTGSRHASIQLRT